MVPRGAVPKDEYVHIVDELVSVTIKDLGGESPKRITDQYDVVLRCEAAAALIDTYRRSESRFFGDRRILKQAMRYAAQAMGWLKQRRGLPMDADFISIALYRFLQLVGEDSPEGLRREAVRFISITAERLHYPASYINHNLNTALVCEYAYNLTGKEQYHQTSKQKTEASLHFFDGNDGRNPEIATCYGIYGVSLLIEIAYECEDNDPELARRLVPYIRASAETFPTYYFDERTGELLAINSRETVKMVSHVPYLWCIDSFEMLASFLNDGRYKSVSKLIYDYWKKNLYCEGKLKTMPRWDRNDEMDPYHLRQVVRIADRPGIASAFAAYCLSRALRYYRNVKPRPLVIAESVEGKQAFFRRRYAHALAVISNVLYSPVALMTDGGAGVVGEQLRGFIYRPDETHKAILHPDGTVPVHMRSGNDYLTSHPHHIRAHDLVAASRYSEMLDVYSTAFLVEEGLVWIVTVGHIVREPSYDLFLYYPPGTAIFFDGKRDKVGTEHKGLRLILLANKRKEHDYLAVALINSCGATLETRRGGVTLRYGKMGDHSILLMRHWDETPQAFADWLKKWWVKGEDRSYEIHLPSGRVITVTHQKGRAMVMSKPEDY